MTTKNFVVKNGLTVGNVVIDATSGNLTGVGNANLGNAVVANFFIGSGANLSNINGANISGNISGNISNANYASFAGDVVNSSQPNITAVGTLANLSVSGNIAAGGLLTSNLYYANGNPWDFQLPAGSNTQVQYNDGAGGFGASANFTFNEATNVLSVNGNISSGNLSTGALSASGNANVGNIGTAGVYATSLSATANANVGNIGAGEGVFTANVSANNLSTTTKITAGNGLQVTTGALSVLAGNLDVTGNLNVTGNVNYSNVTDLVVGDPLIFIGANNAGDTYDLGFVAEYYNGVNGIHTGLARNAGDDIWTFFDGVVAQPTTTIDWANATYPTVKLGNLVTTGTANITGNANIGNIGTGIVTASGNITGGNIITAGIVSATGNITGNYILGNGAFLTGIDATSIQNGTANVRTFNNANVTISAAGNANIFVVTGIGAEVSGTLSVSGNANVANLGVNVITASGNVTGANIVTGGQVTATGNGTFGNIITGGLVSVTGNGIFGNLSTSGMLTAGGSAFFNGPNVIIGNALLGNTASFTGDLTAGNISSSGNITGGNLATAGTLSAGGNANVGNLGTQGVFASTLSSTGNANVGNIGTGGLITATGNIAGGNITTAGVVSATGNITGGNLVTGGVLSATGNVNAGNVNALVGFGTSRSNVAVSTNTIIDQFNPATFRTAKYVISASGDNGYQSVETLLVHDGVNSYITIYGSISSNNSADIIEVSSNISGISGNVAVYATASGANTNVNLVASYIST